MANEKLEKFWLYKDIFNKFKNQEGKHKSTGIFRLGDKLLLSGYNMSLSIPLERIKNKNSLGLNNPIEIFPYTSKDSRLLDNDNFYFDSKVKSGELVNLLIKKDIFSCKVTPYWDRICPEIETDSPSHKYERKMEGAITALQQHTMINTSGYGVPTFRECLAMSTEIHTEINHSIVNGRQLTESGNNNWWKASNTLYSNLVSKKTHELLNRMFNDPEVYFLMDKPLILIGGSEKRTNELWRETIAKHKDPFYSRAYVKFVDPNNYGGVELLTCI